MGLIDIKAGTDPSFVSNNLQIASTCWPQDSVAGELNGWGQWTLNGVYLIDTYSALDMQRFFIPNSTIECKYLDIRVRDITNPSPLQIGTLVVAETWDEWFSYNWQFSVNDLSIKTRTPSGSLYSDLRKKLKRLNLACPPLEDTVIWRQLVDWLLIKGSTEPFIMIPFGDSDYSTRFEKVGIYGSLVEGGLSNPFTVYYALTMQVEQI
jgi:hypothetical protein